MGVAAMMMKFIEYLGDSRASQVMAITLFVALLCFCLVVGRLLQENRWVNESISAIFIVCIAGTVILLISKGTNSHILRFNEELFFIYLLPPIIFNAGFQVNKKQFFHNFFTIMQFGVIGVFISTAILAAGSWWLFPKFGFSGLSARDYLGIGTIFSSTDTVCTLQVLHQDETPLLYSLVFREGVVNDATSIVLFKSVQKIDINRLGGGSAIHLLLGWTFDCIYSSRHSSVREISLMVLKAYLSYMYAELLGLSGILTVFFCGVVMSHYAWHNVTEKSRITTRSLFVTLSFVAETFIFLYVGMDALDIEKWKMSKLSVWTYIGICSTLIFLILLGRAAFVFPLSYFSNYLNRNTSRSSHISFKHQIIIWWAGLMRGAVSIALAFEQFTYSGVTMDPVNATTVTTTIIVVLFSTVVFGLLTKPLVNYFLTHHANINHGSGVSKDDHRLPWLGSEDSGANYVLSATQSLSMLIEGPVYTIHYYWRKFDDAHMGPTFGGPGHNEPF